MPGREYIHLHDRNGTVMHRHKPGLAFGDFFTSIGFALTPDCLTLDTGESYCSAEAERWQMFINDAERPLDPGYIFADLDRILITYGATATQIKQHLAALTDDACRYSQACPWRGKPPPENCLSDPEVPCIQPDETL